VARTRVSNMAMVKKLNCWGADLTDVSVVRNLQSVEVLSLSLNSLTSLSDFQCCPNLQELFVRKNQIQSLAELTWLRDLSRLKHLWLAENPCAEGNDRYRQTVIHNLPQLEKLDNVSITSEERADARFGITLEKEGVMEDTLGQRRISSKHIASDNESDAYLETGGRYQDYGQDEEENKQMDENSYHGQDTGYQSAAYSRPSSCASYQPRYEEEESHLYREQQYGVYSRGRDMSYGEDGDSGCCEQYRAAIMDRTVRRNMVDMTMQQDRNRVDMTMQQDRNSVERTSQQGRIRRDIPRGLSRSRQDMSMSQGRNMMDLGMQQGRNMMDLGMQQGRNMVDLGMLQGRNTMDMSIQQGRRRNRNSNMLSAILCLLNEVDIPSLEVVEMAVRCRMEEMED